MCYTPLPNTDYGYTGQRDLDPGMGGLMDYKARFYSPYLNRFIQPDSIVPNVFYSQSLNCYTYVYNSPLMYTDPSGHITCTDDCYCPGSNNNNYWKRVFEEIETDCEIELDDSFTLREKLAVVYELEHVLNQLVGGAPNDFGLKYGSLRNQILRPDAGIDWQQHPPSPENPDASGDMFVAWVFDAWNTADANRRIMNKSRDALNTNMEGWSNR